MDQTEGTGGWDGMEGKSGGSNGDGKSVSDLFLYLEVVGYVLTQFVAQLVSLRLPRTAPLLAAFVSPHPISSETPCSFQILCGL